MKIKQLTSYPNPNELGLGNTNETYIRMENSLDVSDMFPDGTEVSIVDSISGKSYIVKAKNERTEYRINKLGQLYRDYNVRPGDEIKFTYIEKAQTKNIFFSVTNYNRVYLNVGQKGTEIVNIDRLTSFLTNSFTREYSVNISEGLLLLKYDKSEKKRADSPADTDFYSALVNNRAISKGSYYITLNTSGNFIEVVKKNLIEEYMIPDNSPIAVNSLPSNLPLQQIFYGAPGTGKSHTVWNQTKGYRVFRTTFHPDSDYSTFVGCYKPYSRKKNMLAGNNYSDDQLLSCFLNSNDNTLYPNSIKARYWYEGLVNAADIQKKGWDVNTLASKVIAQGFQSTAYTHEIGCMFKIYEWLKQDGYIVDNKITYEFIPQAFINAYVEAWRCQSSGTPVFLIIEEINRGNCAQIFGDLFQLLDRNENGFSKYEINADSDLKDYINNLGLDIRNIINSDGDDISAGIASGDILLLPNNLYIWATMNTSDQSLFPIDSAFKRRWDWKYVPINTSKENWSVALNGKQYSWTSFLNKINFEIGDTTSSEDKKLGFYFCKAKDNVISAEKFVSKVLFYLYNDVFKDYALDRDFFRYRDGDNKGKIITFQAFFEESGDINEVAVEELLENLSVDLYVVDDIGAAETASGSKKFNFNGVGPKFLYEIARDVVNDYASNNPSLTGQQIRDVFVNACKGMGISHIVETETEYHARDGQPSQKRSSSEITIPNGEKLYVTTQWRAKNTGDNFFLFKDLVDKNGWGTIS